MTTYIGMKNGTETDLVNKYVQIRQDLLDNSKDLENRYEYYVKKYRGNRLEDVNVGIFSESHHRFTLQIFLRTRENKFIKEQLTFDSSKTRIVKESFITNVKELMQ